MSNIFENNIDERMARAIREERKQQQEKNRKRKNKAARRRLLLALIAVCAAVCLCVGLVKVFSSDVYQDEEEFIAFADDTFEEDTVCPESSVDEREYRFSDNMSCAVRYGDWVNGDTKSFLDQRIGSIEESAVSEYTPSALLIDTAAYEADNGTISAVVHYSIYAAEGRHMKRQSSNVETYLFKGDTGKTVDPVQVLNVNYKTKAQDYAYEYFSKTYSSRELSDDWERFVIADDTNFNKFVITDDQISFFFDEDTVVSAEEGTPVINVPDSIIGSTIRPEVLDRYIDKRKPMVALTFDDGPYSKTENEILDTLERNNAVATFFYLGNRVKNDHESAVRAVAMGCELGNHSWSHPVLSQLENKEIISQVNKTNAVIYKYCGVEPVVARPPYGEFNDRVLKKTGMAQILWSIDTLDWQSRDADTIFKKVKKAKKLDGSIILMHSIYEDSAEAVELIVPWLKENGYQMVTVSELIKYKTGQPPQAGSVYKKAK